MDLTKINQYEALKSVIFLKNALSFIFVQKLSKIVKEIKVNKNTNALHKLMI